MFYKSFAKSIVTYGLLLYGTAYKPIMTKIEAVRRRILRAIFFKKTFASLENVFADNKVLTVFEFFLVEILKELFRQLKCESPRTVLQPNENPNPNYQTRLGEKNMLHLYTLELLLIKSP